MSVKIHGDAEVTISLDGKLLALDEEAVALTWSFGAHNGDFGEWLNFLKWLTEQFGQVKLSADPQQGKGDAESGRGMSVRERLIRTAYCFSSQGDAEAARYLMGVIDTIRCDRDRLREHFQGPQTSEPEAEAGSQSKQNVNEAKQ